MLAVRPSVRHAPGERGSERGRALSRHGGAPPPRTLGVQLAREQHGVEGCFEELTHDVHQRCVCVRVRRPRRAARDAQRRQRGGRGTGRRRPARDAPSTPKGTSVAAMFNFGARNGQADAEDDVAT